MEIEIEQRSREDRHAEICNDLVQHQGVAVSPINSDRLTHRRNRVRMRFDVVQRTRRLHDRLLAPPRFAPNVDETLLGRT